MSEGFTLDDIFKNDIMEPFFYNFELYGLDNKKDINTIYINVKNIFLRGLMVLLDKMDGFDVNEINLNDINKMKGYMLSLGLELKLKRYSLEDIDLLTRGLIYDIEKIPDVNIEVTMDWHTQNIKNSVFSISNNNTKSLNLMMSKFKYHYEANYFLQLVNPTNLIDIPLLIKRKDEPNITYIISFEFAKLSDYPYQHRYTDFDTKNIK